VADAVNNQRLIRRGPTVRDGVQREVEPSDSLAGEMES